MIHKSVFIHLVHYEKTFYDNYIETEYRTRYIDYGGSDVRSKKILWKISWEI